MKGLRFRRSVKIAPGLRLNFGKRGLSLSAGPRGATITAGTHGVRTTAGLPGSGLSVTRKLPPSKGRATAADQPQAEAAEPIDPTLPARMGIDRSRRRGVLMIAGVGTLFVGMAACVPTPTGLGALVGLIGFLLLVVGSQTPTRDGLAVIERDRRLELLRAYGEAVCEKGSRAAIAVYARRKESLLLSEVETVRLDTVVEAQSALLDLKDAIEANGGTPPTIDGHERAVGTDACYLAIEALHDKRGDGKDEVGTLYVTNERLLFVGTSLAEAPWGKVAKVDRDSLIFSALRRDRQNPYVFYCTSVADAVRVGLLAEHCLNAATIE